MLSLLLVLKYVFGTESSAAVARVPVDGELEMVAAQFLIKE